MLLVYFFALRDIIATKMKIRFDLKLMFPEKKINVLMITGVYLPEINGAVLQCSQLINNLRREVNYSVLAGSNYDSANGYFDLDGIMVTKVFMPKKRKLKFIIGAVRFYIQLIIKLRKVDIVHIHGFSKRNSIVIALSRILNKKVLLKMTSYGYDDPMTIKSSSYIYWKLFKCCHAHIGVSPAFLTSYRKAGLSEDRFRFIPNGVDLARYHPVSPNEKNTLRSKYGYAEHDNIIIFIGHFSPEKRPMLMYKAWVKLCDQNIDVRLILIGHTRNHFEVDESIVELIRQDAFKRGILPRINFVEDTSYVDELMKVADVFVLPSIREGLPNVLLEAMACALICVVSDLPGVTDWLIDDGVTGLLFDSDDPDVLARKISPYISQNVFQQRMGLTARHFMESKFSGTLTSQMVLDLYRSTMGQATQNFDSC